MLLSLLTHAILTYVGNGLADIIYTMHALLATAHKAPAHIAMIESFIATNFKQSDTVLGISALS